MSNHKIIYRVYPDDVKSHEGLTHDKWQKSNFWINGLAYRNDLNEALALAKLASKECQFPFVVMPLPAAKKPRALLKGVDCYVVGEKER